MLTPQQRTSLQNCNEPSEGAQRFLGGQNIGQRIRDAQADNGPGAEDPKAPRLRNCSLTVGH